MPKSPSLRFKDNLGEASQLLGIHVHLTGTGPGVRREVDALNKGAILFMCASFEAFVEDLASSSYDFIVGNCASPEAVPVTIRRAIAKSIKEEPHDLSPWVLAGTGWKDACTSYKSEVISKHIGPFNTPKYGNINNLLKCLIGFEKSYSCFQWTGMPMDRAKRKLNDFVALRGALAHGSKPTSKVTKAIAVDRLKFLATLSVRMTNEVRLHCHELTGNYPWPRVVFGKVK